VLRKEVLFERVFFESQLYLCITLPVLEQFLRGLSPIQEWGLAVAH